VPDGFQPIVVDRARDRVRYEEANVWMLHAIDMRGLQGPPNPPGVRRSPGNPAPASTGPARRRTAGAERAR
jgi:hypothetical protein